VRRVLVLVGVAVGMALAGCGSGEAVGGSAAGTSSDAVDPDQYADEIIEAFRSTYPAGGNDPEDVAQTADWTAFVTTIEGVEPPKGEDLAHDRMVAGFQAYVDAREEADDVCRETPGPTGPCFKAVGAASDQWQAAMERAYEIPGLSWDTLLG
jgi:hypothetical protein